MLEFTLGPGMGRTNKWLIMLSQRWTGMFLQQKGINNNNIALQSPAIWQHTEQSAQPLEMQLFSQDIMSKLN